MQVLSGQYSRSMRGTKKKRIMQGKSKKNVALLLLEKTPVRQDLRGKDPL